MQSPMKAEVLTRQAGNMALFPYAVPNCRGACGKMAASALHVVRTNPDSVRVSDSDVVRSDFVSNLNAAIFPRPDTEHSGHD
jgi:hypothetical protein